MSRTKTTPEATQRRGFLRGLGLAAGAAAAAAPAVAAGPAGPQHSPRSDTVPAGEARKESEAEKRARPLPGNAAHPGFLPHQPLLNDGANGHAHQASGRPGREAAPRLPVQGLLAAAAALDRRGFLRQAGLGGAGLAALGTGLGAGQGAGGGREDGHPRPRAPGAAHQECLHPLLGRLHRHRRGAGRGLGRAGAGLGIAHQPRHPLRQGRERARTGAGRAGG